MFFVRSFLCALFSYHAASVEVRYRKREYLYFSAEIVHCFFDSLILQAVIVMDHDRSSGRESFPENRQCSSSGSIQVRINRNKREAESFKSSEGFREPASVKDCFFGIRKLFSDRLF